MGSTVPNQILTFTLGEETYGVDILRVQEIRGWTPATRIPHAPPHVLGVLNLRGSIIPVVDLRMRFNLAKASYDSVTVIIVLTVVSRGSRRNFGVVVDAVSDVINVDPALIRPAPDFGSHSEVQHIYGILPVAERMVIMLDADTLVGYDESDSSDDLDIVPAASAA